MLHQFLEVGMLDIGAYREKLQFLQHRAQTLMYELNEDPAKIISYTLVALDPAIPPDDRVITEAYTAVKQPWPTIVNRFRDVPRELLRGVIFAALDLVTADPRFATIAWLTGASYLPYAHLDREAPMCDAFIGRLGTAAEAQAVAHWSGDATRPTTPVPSFDAAVPEVEVPEVDEKTLTQRFAEAAGPYDDQSQSRSTGPNANPQSPSTYPNHAWAPEFAKRAAAGVAAAVDGVSDAQMTEVTNVLTDYGKQLQDYAVALEAMFNEAMGRLAKQGPSIIHQTELLWWKEALYSPSLRRSYRELDPEFAVCVMAYDVHNQVPAICPASVDYLLREAVHAVRATQSMDEADSMTLAAYAERLQNHAALAATLSLPTTTSSGRVPFIALVQAALGGNDMVTEDIQKRLGLNPDQPITLDEAAVWIFRDLQAYRLANQKDES